MNVASGRPTSSKAVAPILGGSLLIVAGWLLASTPLAPFLFVVGLLLAIAGSITTLGLKRGLLIGVAVSLAVFILFPPAVNLIADTRGTTPNEQGPVVPNPR
jgi:hypothetical protein